MSETIEKLSETLKQARLSQGMSQRELSTLINIPQSHISNIENGNVNLKLSSLIEITRALGLELMLVPQTSIIGVEALITVAKTGKTPNKQTPAYSLDED